MFDGAVDSIMKEGSNIGAVVNNDVPNTRLRQPLLGNKYKPRSRLIGRAQNEREGAVNGGMPLSEDSPRLDQPTKTNCDSTHLSSVLMTGGEARESQDKDPVSLAKLAKIQY